MNAYHIKVNKICASCKHKECMGDGTRVCQKMGLKVEQKYVSTCAASGKWPMG